MSKAKERTGLSMAAAKVWAMPRKGEPCPPCKGALKHDPRGCDYENALMKDFLTGKAK